MKKVYLIRNPKRHEYLEDRGNKTVGFEYFTMLTSFKIYNTLEEAESFVEKLLETQGSIYIIDTAYVKT